MPPNGVRERILYYASSQNNQDGSGWRDRGCRTYSARGHRDFDIPGLPAWADVCTIGPPGLDDVIDWADSDVSNGRSLEMVRAKESA